MSVPAPVPSPGPGQPPSMSAPLSNAQRLTLGIVVLFLVDIIWVASSELTEHIFHDEKYNKPFFSTYLKTSMFLIFLFGFIVWTPWHDRCRRDTHYVSNLPASATVDGNPYLPVSTTVEEPPVSNGPSSGTTGTIDDNGNDSTLSPPMYIPVNYEHSSGNESDDSAQHRSVRFSKLTEVRHLPEAEAADAVFSRLSYQATVQAEQLAYRLAHRYGPIQTAQLGATFCLLWFLANYSYQLAISNTEAGIVNLLSSSSSLFTLLLAAAFPSVVADKFTLSKFLAVLISFGGVSLVTISDSKVEGNVFPIGAIFALISAMFYACYLVFLRKKVDHEDKLDIPMFFGFVGLFNLILLWPLFFLLHYTSIETFEWPTKRQWLFMIVNGIIGTVFSEVLWLWGCFLTSSLIATLAISLTIPMSMVADVLLKRISYSYLVYVGALPMVLSFFGVTILSHYEGWDPLLDLFKKCWKLVGFKRRDRRYQRVLVNDGEQRESLIGINSGEEEDEDEEFDSESDNNISNNEIYDEEDDSHDTALIENEVI